MAALDLAAPLDALRALMRERLRARRAPDTTREAVRMSACAKEQNCQTDVIHVQAR
jgi:hypothetical protein